MGESPSQKIMERLESVARKVAPLNRETFVELMYNDSNGNPRTVYVSSEPMKTRDGSVINDLDFPEQLVLYRLAADAIGIKARHGSLKETLKAAYDKRTKEFKEKVLVPYWVYNGLILRCTTQTFDGVRRAVGAKFVDRGIQIIGSHSRYAYAGEVVKAETIACAVFEVYPPMGELPLQISVAKKRGHFNEFAGEVPVDSEIKLEGKGFWYGVSFETDLSAVRSRWDSGVRVLGAGSYGPSYRHSDGVLGAWTDENPKK